LFALGLGVQRGLIDPVKSGPHIGLAMMSIAIGYVLRGVARAGWGREVLPMPRVFDSPPIIVGDLVVTGESLVIVGTVSVLLASFFVVLHATRIGKVVQAVYQSERGAALVGVNVRRFHALMWAVGAALGGVGGLLVAPVTLLHPELGALFLINGFAAMTLGGFGSLPGAVVGGLLIGCAEQLVGGYVSTKIIDMTPYLVIIFVLLIRPVGLFGRAAAVRV
jgi:branched-chain amino acid transport system permease protein